MRNIRTNIAVIGGGPAGLAAAIKAKKAGVKKVIIIERSEELGGLLYQCVHDGFGLQYFKEDLAGPEYAYRFIKLLEDYGIEVYLETMVIEITPNKEIKAISSYGGLLRITADAVILAMGCRERSRGAINIPGTRPAGIFTAGTAQRFINVEGFFPGKRVVILGSGDIGMIMARRMTLEGAKVEAVVEIMPYIGGLVRNQYLCLRDFNIPVYVSHTVSEIHGKDRIEGVSISEVDRNRRIIPGTTRRIDCDTLLLSVGLIPENELSKTAGIELDPVIGGPVVDENMQTNIPGIFAAGNVMHVHDLADYVTLDGERAGDSAYRYISGGLRSLNKRKIQVVKGNNIRYVVPQYISGTEATTLYMRVTKPAEEAVIDIGNGLVIRKVIGARPSEMIKIDISADKIRSVKSDELKVECIIQKEKSPAETVDETKNGIEITCLGCPLACKGRVYLNSAGEIEKMEGFRCKVGEKFATTEIKNPQRVLTGTVRTANSNRPLLPFRSTKPISKKLLLEAMVELSKIEVDKPVGIGDVIMADIFGTGVDIIATSSFSLEKKRFI